MSYYWIILAGMLLLLIVIGIPVIIRSIKIPQRLQGQGLADSELSEAATAIFRETDAEATPLLFHPIKNFAIPGLSLQNENRLYHNPGQATYFFATVATGGRGTHRWLELVSRFTDGVVLCSSNAETAGVFEQPDWHRPRRYPGMKELDRLARAHQQRVEERLLQGAVLQPWQEDTILEEMIASQHRQMEYQVEKGLLRPDPKTGVYRATSRMAWRGIADFLNPLAGEFSPARLALNLGLGLGLALAAIFLEKPLGLEEILRSWVPSAKNSQIFFLLYCPGFVLGGLFVGWQFRGKGFLWGFLISLPAILLLPSRTAQPIFYAILAAQAGMAASRLREAREAGTGRTQANTALIILVVLIVVGFYYMS